MKELVSFFQLFVDPDAAIGQDFAVVMLILYAGAALYMADFYQLVKQKSKAETLAILGIPCVVTMMGSTLAALMVQVPRPGTEQILSFSQALGSEKLQAKLVLAAFVWMFLWAACYLLQRKRGKKEVIRWVISCIPDAVCVAVIIFSFLYYPVSGRSLFFVTSEWVLWVYLYAVYFLCCKTVLLAVSLFVRLYSARITCFRWREGKHPAVFLHRYFYIYQSAILRNVLLFEGGILTFLTVMLVLEPPLPEERGDVVMIMVFLYLGAVFVIAAATAPIRKGLRRFKEWGDTRQLKELFCREYFTQDPIAANKDYVVTRHFLVDVQQPAAVYYWKDLQNVGGWYLDGKGKSRCLYFHKAGMVKFSEAEGASSEAAFQYAKQWMRPFLRDNPQ